MIPTISNTSKSHSNINYIPIAVTRWRTRRKFVLSLIILFALPIYYACCDKSRLPVIGGCDREENSRRFSRVSTVARRYRTSGMSTARYVPVHNINNNIISISFFVVARALVFLLDVVRLSPGGDRRYGRGVVADHDELINHHH